MTMNALDSLLIRLSPLASAERNFRDDVSDSAAMHRVLTQIRDRHDGPGLEPDKRTVSDAVAYFRKHEKPDGWRGLKYVCFGAGSMDVHGWCLLGDEQLFRKMLGYTSGLEFRKTLKCFQSLLRCYWSFPVSSAKSSAVAGWESLRSWLASNLLELEASFQQEPSWLTLLKIHENLLYENPCDRYGEQLLVGNTTEFSQMLEGLGIPSDSWVREEAVLAQLKSAVAKGDKKYTEALPALLKLVMGHAGFNLSKNLQAKCVAMLISRYARCIDRTEHHQLREAAVTVIGNPWLKRSSWDALVVSANGEPDVAAREMVFGWLKRTLIKDFFELLSSDGRGDHRRLNYWSRFVPYIDQMWFALGSEARWKCGENFDDFRSRAKGLLLNLEQSTPENNAFIMRMGEYLAIEFGSKGNALYVFRWDSISASMINKLTVNLGQNRSVSIHDLKSSLNEERKSHRDSPGAMQSWEQKFDEYICPLINQWPEDRAALIPDIEKILSDYSLHSEDNRSRGGALWVKADDKNQLLSGQLTRFGFRFKSGKGWWKE